jgi:hypothetical protein
MASILTTKTQYMDRIIFYPEDGGVTFLRNIGSHALHSATSQKTTLFTVFLVLVPYGLERVQHFGGIYCYHL